ncbi:alpha/beta fold hydrolase BchO [Aquidulcibacter paucihalophilus]|uniref:alpha/beta fold hydrolase BchO n=1 Tax=Aquidulcibacter paucihalophilus TaxID=1978549 RepID=UPI000A18B4C8|nr:alpha/beta fold hydrolase BchO [Aquidulcibacter paucihalophilus]
MYRKPKWNREGMNWPHRQYSRFIQVGDQKWHLQTMGQGPPILLLHGTGSSCHTWAGLAPVLAEQFTLVMPDLPGHGFTQTPPESGQSLMGMARLVRDLLTALDIEPTALIGHSAGAAIAAEMTLSGYVRPQAIIAINGAFQPFKGLAALLFPVAAHVLALNPLTIYAVASGAKDSRRIEKLMRSTGSEIPADMVARYRDLFTAPGHVAGMLGMMANWNLAPLVRKMAGLQVPIYLVSGAKDAAVTPASAQTLCQTVPQARFIPLPQLGHLAHEEDPNAVAAVVFSVLGPSAT